LTILLPGVALPFYCWQIKIKLNYCIHVTSTNTPASAPKEYGARSSQNTQINTFLIILLDYGGKIAQLRRACRKGKWAAADRRANAGAARVGRPFPCGAKAQAAKPSAPRSSPTRPPSSRHADFIDVAAGAWFMRRSVFHRLNRPVRRQIPIDPYGDKH
jgi:hypothetical protein